MVWSEEKSISSAILGEIRHSSVWRFKSHVPIRPASTAKRWNFSLSDIVSSVRLCSLPSVLPQQLFFGTAPELLCTPICVGEAPPPIDGVEGIAELSASLDDLPHMNLGQAT